ncbi:MAG TPA: plastocyanin/azurin family copper-binding protein [Candidatus Krumholzibacteria bacterium]|nr:plastocyanin/azurin family copper-binding protein [Candidatus Krumholzibacteria bacterium]
MHVAHRVAVVVVVAVAALAPRAAAVNHMISILDSQFSPQNLVIHPNDTVTWKNNGVLVHTSTSGNPCRTNGTWDSGALNPGQSFTPPINPFTTVGTFPYFCVFHCAMGMTGTITVETPVAVESRTWGAIKALYRIEAL